jgi:hypothetical protein
VTTEELQQQSTYTDWDFEQVWAIDGTVNDGYPYLIQPYIGSDVQVPVEGETPTEGEAPAIEGESTPAEGQEGELQTTDAPAQASGTGCFAG